MDKLLSIFEQNYFIDYDEIMKTYRHPIDDENIRRITDILSDCASDADVRRTIKGEHEAWETYQELLEEYTKANLKKIDQQEKLIAEKETELAV